ncbi:MAG: 30S ribosomal protein S8 [Planctomycetes bacterium]|nr:30S ribosomal protein S8 [Planctomycetota bacterium]
MMTDPIADLLTRIRNALRVRRDVVQVRFSVVKEGIAQALRREGYLRDVRRVEDGNRPELRIYLKYGPEGEEILRRLRRISRPGRRVYRGVSELKPVLAGIGATILSTPRGVLSDRECREQRVGGEVLAEVW